MQNSFRYSNHPSEEYKDMDGHTYVCLMCGVRVTQDLHRTMLFDKYRQVQPKRCLKCREERKIAKE